MRHQRDFIEGFRLTREGDGLTIEATEYHARPLRLGRKELAELGLRLAGRDEVGEVGEDTGAQETRGPETTS